MEKNGKIIETLSLCIRNDDAERLTELLNEIKREKVETYAQEIIRAWINSVEVAYNPDLKEKKESENKQIVDGLFIIEKETKTNVILSNFVINEPKVFEYFITNFNKYKDYERKIIFLHYTELGERQDNLNNFLLNYKGEISSLLLNKLLDSNLVDANIILKILLRSKNVRNVESFIKYFSRDTAAILFFDYPVTPIENKNLLNFLAIIVEGKNSYITRPILKNSDIKMNGIWVRDILKIRKLLKNIDKKNEKKVSYNILKYLSSNSPKNEHTENIEKLNSILKNLKKQDLLYSSDNMQSTLIDAIEQRYILLIKLLIDFELVNLEMFKNAAEEIDYEDNKVIKEILEFTKTNFLGINKPKTYIETNLNNQIRNYLEESLNYKKEQEKNFPDIYNNPDLYVSVKVDYLVIHKSKSHNLETSYQNKILEEKSLNKEIDLK